MKKDGGKKEQKKLQKDKKEVLFDNALNSDPDFMKDHLEDTKRTYRENLKVLELIRDGEVSDSQYDPKTGQVIKKPIAMDVRVKAIALIKAMTLDKTMADKRDPGQAKDKGKGIDHEESLKKVAAEIQKAKKAEEMERKAAEKKAEKDGKLVKLGREAEG